jgi:hypothetical protein
VLKKLIKKFHLSFPFKNICLILPAEKTSNTMKNKNNILFQFFTIAKAMQLEGAISFFTAFLFRPVQVDTHQQSRQINVWRWRWRS